MSAEVRATQRDQILRLLVQAGGAEVPLPRILELKISQFGARILELRRAGYHIVNRTANVDGKRLSWYRLVETSSRSTPAPAATARPRSALVGFAVSLGNTLPLFAEAGD